jgi:hypothetical protein
MVECELTGKCVIEKYKCGIPLNPFSVCPDTGNIQFNCGFHHEHFKECLWKCLGCDAKLAPLHGKKFGYLDKSWICKNCADDHKHQRRDDLMLDIVRFGRRFNTMCIFKMSWLESKRHRNPYQWEYYAELKHCHWDKCENPLVKLEVIRVSRFSREYSRAVKMSRVMEIQAKSLKKTRKMLKKRGKFIGRTSVYLIRGPYS